MKFVAKFHNCRSNENIYYKVEKLKIALILYECKFFLWNTYKIQRFGFIPLFVMYFRLEAKYF